MSEIFFTADTHFGHGNILDLCPITRQFATAEEMNDTIVERWNAKVGKKDTVYHLGDFAWARNAHEVEAYKRRLNGSVHLILGNHDHKPTRKAKGFGSVDNYREIKVGDQKIILFHYALRTWNASFHGSWMLYGHSHGTLRRDWQTKSFDVGVDVWNFEPLSYEEVAEQMELHTNSRTDKFSTDHSTLATESPVLPPEEVARLTASQQCPSPECS